MWWRRVIRIIIGVVLAERMRMRGVRLIILTKIETKYNVLMLLVIRKIHRMDDSKNNIV
jgi:hypothetical protein